MFGLIFGGWWYFFIFFFLLLKIQQTDMKMQIHVAFLVRWHGSHSVDLCTNPWWAIPVCANTSRELLQNMEEWEKISSLPPQGDVINSRTLPPELCPFPDNLFFPSAFWSLFLLSLGEKKTNPFFLFLFSWLLGCSDCWWIRMGDLWREEFLGCRFCKDTSVMWSSWKCTKFTQREDKNLEATSFKEWSNVHSSWITSYNIFWGKKKSGKISHFP